MVILNSNKQNKVVQWYYNEYDKHVFTISDDWLKKGSFLAWILQRPLDGASDRINPSQKIYLTFCDDWTLKVLVYILG